MGCCCFFSSQLCCPPRFQNSPQTRQWEGFLVLGNFSYFMTPSPGWVSILNSFVSLFIFYILSYLLSKTMGCLSGCPESSTSVQKLFCGIYSAFKWSFDEFLGEKVISPSSSSAILELPPVSFLVYWFLLLYLLFSFLQLAWVSFVLFLVLFSEAYVIYFKILFSNTFFSKVCILGQNFPQWITMAISHIFWYFTFLFISIKIVSNFHWDFWGWYI